MNTKKDIYKLAADFERCQKILLALGDENRQPMILEMMKIETIQTGWTLVSRSVPDRSSHNFVPIVVSKYPFCLAQIA